MSQKLNAVIGKYIALRDRRDEINRKAKEDVAKINEKLEAIEGKLMGVMDGLGMESIKSDKGTAYVSTTTRASVADWDATLAFIKRRRLWNMLEQRVSKKAVEEYIEAKGDVPPGVDVSTMRKLNVRRSS
jgi:hypothetical protein